MGKELKQFIVKPYKNNNKVYFLTYDKYISSWHNLLNGGSRVKIYKTQKGLDKAVIRKKELNYNIIFKSD